MLCLIEKYCLTSIHLSTNRDERRYHEIASYRAARLCVSNTVLNFFVYFAESPL